MSDVDMTGGAAQGIVLNPAANQAVNGALFTNILSDQAQSHAWVFEGNGLISDNVISSSWAGMSATGNGLYVTSSSNVDGLKVIGSQFHANALNGINLSGGVNILIDGNQFFQNSFLTPGVHHGIAIAPGVSKFTITNNQAGQGGYFSSHGPLQSRGIIVNAGASNNYTITGNQGFGNIVALLDDAGAGTTKTVFGNGTSAVLGAFSVTGNVGFYGTTPIAKPTGVAVTAAGIHAALTALGLIAP